MSTSITANAGLILSLSDPSFPETDVIVTDDTDGGIGTPTILGPSNRVDELPGDGRILFGGAVGGFIAYATIGRSKPVTGPARLELSSGFAGGDGTLEIGITDTDFMPLANNILFDIRGTTQGAVEAQAFIDPSNTEFGEAFATSLLTAIEMPRGFSASTSLELPQTVGTTGPYSLSQRVTITHTNRFQVSSFDASLQVPEPSSIVLMGLGLLGLGWTTRLTQKTED